MDLYNTLGVAKNATKEMIIKAYRTLAKNHHPDKGGDPDMFNQICQAYTVLIDEKQRSFYDEHGFVNDKKDNIQEFIQSNLIQASTTWIQAVMANNADMSFEQYFDANYKKNVIKIKQDLNKVAEERRSLEKIKEKYNDGGQSNPFTIALKTVETDLDQKEFHLRNTIQRFELLKEEFNKFDFSNLTSDYKQPQFSNFI